MRGAALRRCNSCRRGHGPTRLTGSAAAVLWGGGVVGGLLGKLNGVLCFLIPECFHLVQQILNIL